MMQEKLNMVRKRPALCVRGSHAGAEEAKRQVKISGYAVVPPSTAERCTRMSRHCKVLYVAV